MRPSAFRRDTCRRNACVPSLPRGAGRAFRRPAAVSPLTSPRPAPAQAAATRRLVSLTRGSRSHRGGTRHRCPARCRPRCSPRRVLPAPWRPRTAAVSGAPLTIGPSLVSPSRRASRSGSCENRSTSFTRLPRFPNLCNPEVGSFPTRDDRDSALFPRHVEGSQGPL